MHGASCLVTLDEMAWEAQLAKLKAYQCRHGDCNVPRKWAEEPELGTVRARPGRLSALSVP